MAAADVVEVVEPPAPVLEGMPRITRPAAGLSVPPPAVPPVANAAPPAIPGTSSRMEPSENLPSYSKSSPERTLTDAPVL